MCYNKGIFKWNDKNNREMNDREMNKFTRSSNELIELMELGE